MTQHSAPNHGQFEGAHPAARINVHCDIKDLYLQNIIEYNMYL